jgi:predicted nucleic acid-binding protein
MILVDTSVWVQHLRAGSSRLKSLLLEEQVLCHPFVIGELACGSIARRDEVLRLLAALPQAREATHEEALVLLERERLHGSGLGWIDTHLLASARLSRAPLWTLDGKLARAAGALGIAG